MGRTWVLPKINNHDSKTENAFSQGSKGYIVSFNGLHEREAALEMFNILNEVCVRVFLNDIVFFVIFSLSLTGSSMRMSSIHERRRVVLVTNLRKN